MGEEYSNDEVIMGFQSVPRLYVIGTSMLGLSIDPLYSEEFDKNALKQWAHKLSTLLSFDTAESFTDAFLFELFYFCVYIAASDGRISDKEIDEIAWLIDDGYVYGREHIEEAADRLYENGWANSYPLSFRALVYALGSKVEPAKAIWATGNIARFYKQIARYIYSLDNSGNLSENQSIESYLDAFTKYVERVSVIGFDFPRDEETIEQVCASWNQLAAAAESKTREQVPGVWRPASGDAFFKGGLSTLVLEEGGKGHMLKKKFIGTEEIPVTWDLSDMSSGQPSPVVHIPSMSAHVLFPLIDSGRVWAIVKSTSAKLNNRIGMYHRVYSYEMR